MFTRKEIGLFITGLVSGFFVGGLIWYQPTKEKKETITVTKTVHSVEQVRVVVTVFVEKTVIKERWMKADMIIEKKETRTDGTILSMTESYGLGLVDLETRSEQFSVGVDETIEREKNVSLDARIENQVVSQDRWQIGVWESVDWRRLDEFDYKQNMMLSVTYRMFNSPFWLGVGAGLREGQIGVGFSF